MIERRELTDGWEVARVAAGAAVDPRAIGGLSWVPARVPGTVAGAGFGGDLDADDWWFRLHFDAVPGDAGEEVVLGLDGVATVFDVFLNQVPVAQGESMFAAHEVVVGDRLSAGGNELVIRCRALAPLLAGRRTPRARWRTKLVAAPNLRFYRTMLLGRAPGFAPGPAVVGPWRPVWLERRHGALLEDVRVRPRLTGENGVVQVRGRVRSVGGDPPPGSLVVAIRDRAAVGAPAVGELAVDPADGTFAGTVPVPAPARWWPHTHGTPTLHDLLIGDPPLYRTRIGFRSLEVSGELAVDGLALRINDVPVFCRGAVWTPLDLSAPDAGPEVLRPVLDRVLAAGMNMLRVVGTGAYESDAFHDLCDERGILVWQDFMFANLDYPESDPQFRRMVDEEARAVLRRLGGRPSLAALCGGSEVAQQVAMLGLDPSLAEGPLYGELLPAAVADADLDAPYIPSAPWGGELPFRPGAGIANYYGVGGYLRPLEDARRAEVRFAAECLAFANVPDEAALAALPAPGGPSVGSPAWKAGVPRDAGVGWDFDDVRDHYLGLLFGVDPAALRRVDQERYLELSRAVTGEVMAETFGEWRRSGSTCHGALVLWLKDLAPGAGWGVLDHRGEPKCCFHHLRRALAPVSVWMTDEGLGGLDVHVANDGGAPVVGRLRVALYRDFEVLVGEAEEDVEVAPRSVLRRGGEALLGRFVDLAWAYRFGPVAQDLVVASLEQGEALLAQAFRFPAGRPLTTMAAGELGLAATLDGPVLRVASRRFAYGVRVRLDGAVAADDAFGVEPGHERVIPVEGEPVGGELTALNLRGRVRIAGP